MVFTHLVWGVPKNSFDVLLLPQLEAEIAASPKKAQIPWNSVEHQNVQVFSTGFLGGEV